MGMLTPLHYGDHDNDMIICVCAVGCVTPLHCCHVSNDISAYAQ